MTEFVGYLVWFDMGNGCVSAYKSYEVTKNPKGEEVTKSLYIQRLTHEQMGLPLDILMKRYPYVPT